MKVANHVANTLIVGGDRERIVELFETFKNDDYGVGTIDFKKIIPVPENIYDGDLDQIILEECGKNNWYDWRNENWGTPSNAWGYSDDYCFKYKPGRRQRILFYTAWRPPIPIVEKLAELYPNLDFSIQWQDEDLKKYQGWFRYSGGKRIEDRSNGIYSSAYKTTYELYKDTSNQKDEQSYSFYNKELEINGQTFKVRLCFPDDVTETVHDKLMALADMLPSRFESMSNPRKHHRKTRKTHRT